MLERRRKKRRSLGINSVEAFHQVYMEQRGGIIVHLKSPVTTPRHDNEEESGFQSRFRMWRTQFLPRKVEKKARGKKKGLRAPGRRTCRYQCRNAGKPSQFDEGDKIAYKSFLLSNRGRESVKGDLNVRGRPEGFTSRKSQSRVLQSGG